VADASYCRIAPGGLRPPLAYARLIGAIVVMVLPSSPWLRAADTVRTSKGPITGKIESVGKLEIRVERSAGKVESYHANEVQYVSFDGEPPKLNLARTAAIAGRCEEALRLLADLGAPLPDRKELKDDLEYYQAMCTAKLALAGAGDLGDAVRRMRAFVQTHPESHHYFAACELLGDLFAAVRSYPNALEQYTFVEQAPWPDYKMRGAVSRGRVQLAQQNFDAALAAFASVIALADQNKGDLVEAQRVAAVLGKAEALAGKGNYDEAVSLLEGVMSAADPENAELHAHAYVVLGNCLKKADRKRAALLAYLHVDVLYDSFPEWHAIALENLAELWTAAGEPKRAAEALAVLDERYKSRARKTP